MIRDEWRKIAANQDVRQNLSKIRQEIKDKENLRQLSRLIQGEETVLTALLASGDAKTRKNAALLMGDLGRQEFLAPVFEAYLKEEQRFVKSSYLTAMENFDYREKLPKLKERLEQLSHEKAAAENQKHLMEEMRALSSLIVHAEGIKTHSFTGWNKTHDIILLTNRNFTEYTKAELALQDPDAKIRTFGAGVRARTNHLNWMNEIRTYHELLFVVKGMETARLDASQMAETIVRSELLPWLDENHEGEAPYFFRVEMKSKRPLSEKSAFVKKLSGLIERLSDRRLTNSADHYEVELRVIESKEEKGVLLVKLYTLKDERFSYRKETVPTSIRTVNAALTAALAKEYLKEHAQVLDPFCGVGTMLTERNKAVMAGSAYGVDIQEDAILKARRNTEEAGQIVHYINRDFFSFKHEYLFDEVITDMPFKIGRITEEDVAETYRRFFNTISGHLKPGAVMVLYSHDRELTEQLAAKNGFTVFQKFEISKKEGTYVLLLRQSHK